MMRLRRALAPACEIESEIGRGGMAIVYRGRDTRLKRGVAVKLLPPDLAFRADIRTRFLREAETAARLGHPNIVPIYAVDERDGLVYFVMALITGESVGDRLRRAGALAVSDARRILREVADALAFAHEHGVVHRDIKPDNVLLDSDSGRAMVTDFGIARAATEEGGASRLTATGAAIGTPAYMSPEQCVGDRDIDGRSDLYSLGTVAYQMLTGEPPFSGNNAPSVMMKQVTERPVPVRRRRGDVPEDLERIVMRLLEKDPADRFADGAALVAALDGAPLEPLRSRAPDEPRRRPLTVGEKIDFAREKIAERQLDVAGLTGLTELTELTGLRTGRLARREARDLRRAARRPPKSLPDRLSAARRRIVSYTSTSAMLFGINYATTGGHGYWWCVFPMLAMGLGVVKELGGFWADGIPLRAIINGQLPAATPTAPPGGAALAGPHGEVLRQAMTDHRHVQDMIARLSDAERAMLPDVKSTANALYERIVALATALDRPDGQVGTQRGPALDARIAQAEQQPGDGDRERRLGLLRRQRDMLAELVRSRATLLEQYESAGLLLQNLALDLLKVRSSGLDSALGGINNATQEARALSREIGYVLNAADELRGLES
ncbi:MAG: protein kinase [Gemmatimonadetes bacterium]|nr:protein kinase [Gemmatimonadota bacterium]